MTTKVQHHPGRAADCVESPIVLHTRVVTGAGGGPEKTILNSPRYLHALGYRALCAYMRPSDDARFDEIRRKARQWNADLLEVEDRGPWDWKVVTQFLQMCRENRVSIWHGHDYKSNALGLLLRKFRPMRLVTTVHGWVSHTSRTPMYYCIDRLCLPRYDKVICVSQDLYETALASGVSPSRCVLIENAIDTEEFRRVSTVEEAKRKLRIDPQRIVVGAVGRLSPEKGFDLLIQAVDQLVKQGLDIELMIAGEGSERAKLLDLAAQLGCADRIRLTGYCSDVRDFYQAMDVFALSSLREGLPNVLLEALAMEVPVVTTRIAGVPRLITDGINGLLVNSGSVKELTRGLRELIRNEPLRHEMRQRGREIIVRFHSFANRMEKIRAIYDEVSMSDESSAGLQLNA